MTNKTPHVQASRPPVMKNHEWFWWRRVTNRYQDTLSGRPPRWDAGAWTAVRVNTQGLVDYPYHDKPILAGDMGGEWWSEPISEPPNVEPLPRRCEHCGQLCKRETPIETPPGPPQSNDKISPRIDENGEPWCSAGECPQWPDNELLICKHMHAGVCTETIRRQRDEARAKIERLQGILAGISLVSQRNDSPSHVLVTEMGRMARAALTEAPDDE